MKPAAQLCHMDRGALVVPLRTNAPGARAPGIYLDVCAQFGVAENPRYAPAAGLTFCNVYVSDATNAMGALIPHWVLPDGTPAAPRAPGARELNCNKTDAFLRSGGAGRWGWTLLDGEAAARVHANAGRPTVALWRNPSGGPGHIGLIMPSPAGGPTLLSQAGKRCFHLEPLPRGFATVVPSFWGHT